MIGDGAAVLVRRAMASRGREATPADRANAAGRLHRARRRRVASVSQASSRPCAPWRPMDGASRSAPTSPSSASRELLAIAGRAGAVCRHRAAATAIRTRKPDPAAPSFDLGGRGGTRGRGGDGRRPPQRRRRPRTGAGVPCIFAAWGYGAAAGGGGERRQQAFPEVARLARGTTPARLGTSSGCR